MTAPADSSHPAPKGIVWIAGTLAMPGAIMFTIVNPVMPLFEDRFDASAAAVSWLVTGYLISSAVAVAVAGQLVARLGARRTVAIVTAVVLVGGGIASAAPTLEVAVVGRCLQGASGAILPTGLTVIRYCFTAQDALPAYATLSTLGAVGGGGGLLLGGPLASVLDPRAVFWAPALATLLTGTLISQIPGIGRRPSRIDLGGIILSAVGISLLLTAMSFWHGWFPDLGWFGLLAAGIAAAAAWYWWERRVAHPMVDLKLLRGQGNGLILLVTLLTGSVMLARLTTMPAYAQTPIELGGLGVDPTAVGLLLAPTSLCVLIGGYLVRKAVTRFGPRSLMLLSVLILAAGNGMFIVMRFQPWEIALGSGICGVGIGGILATTSPLILRIVPLAGTTAVLSAVAIARTLGSSLGSQLPVAFLSAPSSPFPLGLSPTAHAAIAAGTATAMALAAICVSAVPRREAPGDHPRRARP